MSRNSNDVASVVVVVEKAKVKSRLFRICRLTSRQYQSTRPKWLPRKMVSPPDTDSATYIPHQGHLDVQLLPVPSDVDKSHHARSKNGEKTSGFQNPWPSWRNAGLSDVCGAFRKGAVLKSVPADGEGEAFEKNGRLVRVRKPEFRKGEEGWETVWLGHASVLVRVPRQERGGEEGDKVGVIFDPMFSKR